MEEVEYKVWIVDFLRQPRQIAVEDDDGCWDVEVNFYDDDWAWGHDQDRHASFRVRSQGLRDLLENEPSKRASTKEASQRCSRLFLHSYYMRIYYAERYTLRTQGPNLRVNPAAKC